MSQTPKQMLEERLAALDGVTKKQSAYLANGEEFVKLLGDQSLQLKMNAACKAKIGGALKSESRAKFDKNNPDWVTLTFASDLDVEFVFLYIRYSWKFL